MKLLLLAALIALAACTPPPSHGVQVGPSMCIVKDGAVIRETPCPEVAP